MAGTLKRWRESASLIIASKKLPLSKPKKTFMSKILKKQPDPVQNTNEECLRLLLLKRHSDSPVHPNVYVFPGGTLDNSDFSKEWLDILGDTEANMNLFTRGTPGPSIFSRTRDEQFSAVPGEIALRIAAIRETFEESGVLLARPAADLKEKKNNLSAIDKHPMSSTVCNLPGEFANLWRNKIVSDSSNFLLLCKEMGMVPDIWSLYEWSNWLTPNLRNARFDTAFFVSCVDEAPPIFDSAETGFGMWSNPARLLTDCSKGSLTLAPPQLYELSRLVRFTTVDNLLDLAWKRSSSNRVERWMPVIYTCADGVVFVLPGDDLYPDDPDFTGEATGGPKQLSETVAELQEICLRHHRAIIHKDKQISLHCNIKFVDGHILPMEFNKKQHDINFG